MKKIEVLISTMDRSEYSFVGDMNLSTDFILVNQGDRDRMDHLSVGGKNGLVICDKGRGLSRSRNKAISASSLEICVIADDDVVYDIDYEKKILKAYESHPDADIIAFQVKRINTDQPKKFREEQSWENYLTVMKISSVEITFKRKSIVDNDIKFNPMIGAGAEFCVGEENIFLYDALKKGLKILYLPINIAVTDSGRSSWFKGYNERYFNSVGAAYYCMTHCFYWILIIQFAIRKYFLYKGNMPMMAAIYHMFAGALSYKNKYDLKK
jgi:glycosyltransferase involved in cell wall biosynthesis